MESFEIKKWYKKKRYYIPLALFGVLAIVGLANEPASNIDSQKIQNSQNQEQVKDQTLIIPSYQEPIKAIQQQPNPKPSPTPLEAPKPTPAPTPTYSEPSAQNQSCCKVCSKGKACGNSCISRSYTCHQPPGCACDAY